MNNLNSVLLEGNLCRDPELRYTPKGTAVCTLVVASNRSYKVDSERHEEVSFVEATTWGKLATVCAEHLAKGRGVRVVGRLKQERWEDGDGNARAKLVHRGRARRVPAAAARRGLRSGVRHRRQGRAGRRAGVVNGCRQRESQRPAPPGAPGLAPAAGPSVRWNTRCNSLTITAPARKVLSVWQ